MTLLTKLLFVCFSLLAMACWAQTNPAKPIFGVHPGADQLNLYLPALKGKRVGMVVNHTSRIGTTHVVDSLITLGITIKTIFAPEHGFRGQATDGEEISSGRDPRTGIMITSLYGKNYKPTPK